jgi:salicylate biosynthesis isochorismate synthase/menaquinone-specific isochorismate synthase
VVLARPELLRRLDERIRTALARARRTGATVLASTTALLDGEVDPVATVAVSRSAGDDWFSFEQCDRDGYAVAGLGCVHALVASGDERLADVARRWRRLCAGAVADPVGDPAGSGLTAVGGFAFDGQGGHSPVWEGFSPASLIVPAISLARRHGRTALTVTVSVSADDTAEGVLNPALSWLTALRTGKLPMLDPSPSGVYRVHSPMPPAHYEHAVGAAVIRIREGGLDKVVLARELEAHAPRAHDPAAIMGVLRQEFPSCYVFAVGRGEATFLAASPELLVRREGQRASTVALAGSIGRSADPAVDDHLGERLLRSDKDREENAIVARAIARVLRPHSVWVAAAPEPAVIKVANIQHLATPIRAQLASPRDALELAGLLHPTPAVGGDPRARAVELIPALEGFDRGWYAGGVGWTDSTGDGEFCVSLRCALLRGPMARLYAGCGIVRDSDPAGELAETEIKFGALLPLLAG